MNVTELNVLKNKLEPFLVELSKTHTPNDIVFIEYPIGSVRFEFKTVEHEAV